MRVFIILSVLAAALPAWGAPLYEAELIFDPAAQSHGHVHASCIIRTPGGNLRAVWYESGTKLPPPYSAKMLDRSDNVRIGGARKPKGATAWEAPFIMADTFGVSDNNPCMVIDARKRLWLIYGTLVGVPDKAFDSGLVRYCISSDYEKPGVPTWEKSDILIPHVEGLSETVTRAFDRQRALAKTDEERAKIEEKSQKAATLLKDIYALRLGWMGRVHPNILSDGTLMLPLSNENFAVSAFAFTKDGGETWTLSKPVEDIGINQPTVVELPDKTLVGFFRNKGSEHRIKRSESKDGGMTWGPVSLTDLPNPSSGIEAVLLKNGHLVMIYNDREADPRDRLAVSISDNLGKTWKWTRHLENTPNERFDYPSLIEAPDGTLDATYSYSLKTVKHARFNEEWVQAGDK